MTDEEIAFELGKSNNWLKVLRCHNGLRYRYTRYIGKGNYIEGYILYNNMFNDSQEVINDFLNEFKYKATAFKYLSSLSNDSLSATASACNGAINCIRGDVRTYKRARKIAKLCDSFNYDEAVYDNGYIIGIK